jgi:iron complex transport system substrate-binding protein
VQLVSLEPESIEDVFEQILLIGRLTHTEGEGLALVDGLRQRLHSVAERLDGRERPSLVFLEWVDPLFGCGHWTPQLVELAGGHELLGVARRPARTLAWQELLHADPDVIVIGACGFSLDRSLDEAHRLTVRPGWDGLQAVQSGSVYVLDGNAYFSRPGPRLVDSVEILAALLHPGIFPEPSREAGVPVSAPVEKGGSRRHH